MYVYMYVSIPYRCIYMLHELLYRITGLQPRVFQLVFDHSIEIVATGKLRNVILCSVCSL